MSSYQQEIELTVYEHISEIRSRLFFSVIVLICTTMFSFLFAQPIAELLARPIGGLDQLRSIEVTENVSIFMRISLLSGLVMALPVILWQVVGFIMPGLDDGEKFWVKLFIPTACLFFLGGLAFSYFVMLPNAVPFLIRFMGITTSVRPGNYFSFVLNLLFWIGTCFEIPLVMFLLGKLQLVNVRTLAKGWRLAVVLIALLSALITPTPDPVNMGLLMLPLFLLYLLSLLFVWIAQKCSNKEVDDST